MREYSKFLGVVLLGVLVACQGSFDEGGQGEIESTLAPLLGTEDPAAIPGQYIVVLNAKQSKSADRVAISNLITKVELAPENTFHHAYDIIPAFAAELSDASLQEIRKNPDVAYVEQDKIISLNTVHNTNNFFNNFNIAGLDRIDERNLPLDNLFDDKNRTGAGVHAYILDTGILSSHQEFTGRIGNGFTSINDGNGTQDCNDHGSHVASIVGGTNVGVARDVILHPVRVLSCFGSGSISGIINGMNFAANDCQNQNGPCVANLSLGGGASSALDNSVTAAVNAGVTVVVAAGNENQNACNVSPARTAAAITVGASVPTTDARAGFSNFGTCVDIFAPGTSIPGAGSGSSTAYVAFDGTSQASPHVAGVAASILGVNSNLSPAEVFAAIESAATSGVISNAGGGSPNLLLFHDVDLGGGPPPINSCEDRCGEVDANALCQCDDQCAQNGDCCSDIDQFCPVDPGDFVVLTSTDFESNLGGYTDGGRDATRFNNSFFANSGNFSVRLRDNSGSASSIFLGNGLNLTSFGELQIEFSFVGNSMESGEDFFVEVDSGSGFNVVAQFVSGSDFTNGVRDNVTLNLTGSDINFSSNVRVRFRCDASSNADQVYIDDVVISAK